MTTVLYIHDRNSFPDWQKLDGVSAVAAERGWNLQTAQVGPSATEMRQLLRVWVPDGIIVNDANGNNEAAIQAGRGKPLVVFSHNDKITGKRLRVLHVDSERLNEDAVRELLTIPTKSLVYVNFENPTARWNVLRREKFVRALKLQGRNALLLQPKPRASARETQRLAKTLADLPRPVSVFAANDATAVRVLSACTLAGLSVPDDVAVLGVDNDQSLCEIQRPTLSSIGFDFIAAGRLAAESLDALISGRTKTSGDILYPPAGVIRRESTRRLVRANAGIRQILERIRLHACEGLGAREALADFPGSRRLAEIRFRELVGHSTLEEIRAVRLAEARRLLTTTELSVAMIASRVGYQTQTAFTRFYKSMTGRAPLSDRMSSTM